MSKVLRMEWELEDALYDAVIGNQVSGDEAARRALVLDGVRLGRVSVRKGAEILSLDYPDFLGVLAAHRVPVCDYEDGWLGREIDTLSGQ